MSAPINFPVDSKKGIELLIKWARDNRVVLSVAHERIAKKYGVSIEGVIIARRIPR